MEKLLKTLLVVLMLVTTIGTNTVFAEGEEPAPETPVTVTTEDVKEALDDATKEELEAAVVAIPEAIVTLNPSIIVDEIVAAVNDELLAKDNVEDIEDDLVQLDTVLTDAVTDTKINMINASDELAKAEAERDSALAELNKAEEANKTAQNNLDNEKEAISAAADAQIAADKAAENAANAETAATNAKTDADNAKEAYEAAVKEYEEIKAQVEKELAEGVISAEEATKRTEDALKRANAYKDFMESAKDLADDLLTDAENAHKEATEARKQAEAETEAAREELREAREDLLKAEEELAKATVNAALETGKDLAIVAVTDTVLGAAMIAVDIADGIVAYNEKELKDLKKEKEDLDAAIKKLQDQIDVLNDELNGTNEEDPGLIANAKSAKETKEKAEQALNDAIAALELAKQAQKDAEAVITERDAAAERGFKAEMEAMQNNVTNAEISKAEKEQAVKDLTVLVTDYESNRLLGDVETNYAWEGSLEDELFVTVTIGEEEKEYAVRVDDNNIVQYYEVTRGTTQEPGEPIHHSEKKVTSLNEIDSDNLDRYIAGPLNVPVTQKNGKYYFTVSIPTFLGSIDIVEVEAKQDKDGIYYNIPVVGTKRYINVTQKAYDEPTTVEVPFTNISDESVSNSNVITDRWAAADEADQKVNDANAVVKDARDELSIATSDALTAQNKVTAAQNAKEKLENKQSLSAEEAEQLANDIVDLDHKLNGNLVDNIVRAIITGDGDALKDKVTEEAKESAQLALDKAQLQLSLLNPLLSSEKRAEIRSQIADIEKRQEQIAKDIVDLGTVADDVENIMEIIKGIDEIRNGDVINGTMNSGKAIAEILQNDNISIKTKAAIVGIIENMAEKAHDAALDNLKKTAEEQEEILREKAGEVAEAGIIAASAANDVLLAEAKETAKRIQEVEAARLEAIAEVNAAIAQDAYNYAERLAKEADDADKAAKEALELLKQLKVSDLVDDTKLKEAEQNAKDAADAAQAAREAADAAKDAADKAQDAADKAKAAADEAHRRAQYVEPSEETPVAPTVVRPVPSRTVTPAAETEEVIDEITPQATVDDKTTEEITPAITPAANNASWSIINLALAVVAAALAAYTMAKSDKKTAKVCAVIIAVLAAVAVATTEDFSLPMGMVVNKTTPVMVAGVIAQIAVTLYGKTKIGGGTVTE